MKKFIAFLAAYFMLLIASYAQTYDTTQYFGKTGYTFHYLNKTPITTGILSDYGIEFLNLNNYTGTALHDSNFVSLNEWRMLYASIFTSQISINTLPSLDTLNNRMNSYSANAPIPFAGLYYTYQKLRDDAITSNLVYASGDRLYDVVGRTQSPYQNKELFAIAPVVQAVPAGSNSFIFKPELFTGNTGKTIQSIGYDSSGGSSYTTVALNTPFTIAYAEEGFYNVSIKIVYTDATIRYGHTKIAVKPVPPSLGARFGNTQPTPPTTEAIAGAKLYLGVQPQGEMTIDLARNNTTGQIRKPLIVVEGFDADGGFIYDDERWWMDDYVNRLDRDINTQNQDPITLNEGLDDINEYDLIFINFANGTDHIQRNAFLVERVIELVNARKTTYGGVRQQNVIIGASMGGLCARYALRDMELTSVAHETRLFISHDVPYWGANIPVGAQLAVQHLAPWNIIDFTWQRGISWRSMFPEVVDALAMFNSPAAKQMLIQRYVLNSDQSIFPDNTTHAIFLNEINTMGWPVNCRNMLLSNGTCNGTKQFADNSTIFTVDGGLSMTYFGTLWRSYL